MIICFILYCLSREHRRHVESEIKARVQENSCVESRKFPRNYRFDNKISPLCESIPIIITDRGIFFARYVAPHSYYHSQYRMTFSRCGSCNLQLGVMRWWPGDLEKYTRLARKPLRTHTGSIRRDNNEKRDRHEKSFSEERKKKVFFFSYFSIPLGTLRL